MLIFLVDSSTNTLENLDYKYHMLFILIVLAATFSRPSSLPAIYPSTYSTYLFIPPPIHPCTPICSSTHSCIHSSTYLPPHPFHLCIHPSIQDFSTPTLLCAEHRGCRGQIGRHGPCLLGAQRLVR